MNLKQIFQKIIVPIVLLFVWIKFTLSLSVLDYFNSDEPWHWVIAKDLNLWEICKLMHYEGHSMLWYLVLKPFTYIANFFPNIYPEIIKYINVFFCFLSTVLLCFFAPINNFIKLLIIFSSPFMVIYPSLGRPYGLTIFLLFLVSTLYKNRLKYPIIFSVLIFLLTNACVNGLFGALIIGCFFLYDLYIQNNCNFKSKNFLVPLGIIFSGFLFTIFIWFPVIKPNYINTLNNIQCFCSFFCYAESSKYYYLSTLIYFPVTLMAFILNTKKNRWTLFMYFIFISILLFYIVVAPGRNYHYYFLYVYLIVLYWLKLENDTNFKINKPAFLSLSILIVSMSLLYNLSRYTHFWFYRSSCHESAKIIYKIIPRNSTVYIFLDHAQGLIPYLENKYKLFTLHGDKIPSFEAYKNIYQDNFIKPDDINISIKNGSYYIIHEVYGDKKIFDEYITNKKCMLIKEMYYVCKLTVNNSKNY